MIEPNNPEIDVNVLMERVRQEAARIRVQESNGETRPRARIRRFNLPLIPEMDAPPTLGFSRPLDPKMERSEARLKKARGMIEVSSAIPKLFRGLFRRQGGFNRAALETLAELAKANVQLNKRVQELTIAAQQQNQWLRTLTGQRQSETGWRNAAAAILTDLSATPQKISELEGNLAEMEAARKTEAGDLSQLLETVRILQEDGERAGEHLKNLQGQADQERDRVSVWRDEFQREAEKKAGRLEADRSQIERQGEHLRHLQEHVNREVELLRAAHDELNRHGEHLRNLQGETAKESVRAIHYSNLEAALARLEERVLNDSIYLKGELSRHSALLQISADSAMKKPGGSGDHSTALLAPSEAGQLDSFYLSFENRFRGKRSEIKDRIRFYLPVLGEVKAGQAGRPVVDLGCGRGEWLELLREEGLEAIGVDLNSAMVAQCRGRSLTATHADAIAFLRSLPDESQGAVTGFHIIEHLPLEILVELVHQTRRVLLPGGVAIFESPNCKNLMVGACNFNIDPTHRNPVHPETAQFILETDGFEEVTVHYLSPSELHPFNEGDKNSPLLTALFYGPQDFAVVGRKPKTQ